MWSVRCLPTATERLRRERTQGPRALQSGDTRHCMSYAVKEIFYTLQGEGANTGRAAVFCRFAACNLWTGREEDRAEAICNFCDTDFVGTDGPGGGRFASPTDLAKAAKVLWPKQSSPTSRPL